jgi:E3 ubiquitin-protein ligase ATL6/9/15/31/42/55
MLLITFFVLAYAKYCGRNQNNFLGRYLHHQNFHGLIRSSSRFSGIGEEVINSMPFFRFSSLKGSKEGLECAVCISKFEDSDVLRLLPKCKHAFHENCIDQWLKSHSSCPLCRYKIDPKDVKSFTYSRSWRHLQNPSNLAEDPNLEIFVEREHDRQVSSCFNPGSSFQISNDNSKKEELLVQAGGNADDNRKLFHKFMHKIIISDVLIKSRWSDANSSDFLSLNTEMLGVMSSNRFTPLKSSSARFYNGLSRVENLEKVKDDTERKRLSKPQFPTVDRSNSVPSSSLNSSKMLNPVGKRSTSEITIFSRFRQLSAKNKMKESASLGNGGKDERIRMLWLPIARRTIQWFAGRERNLRQLEHERQASSV